MGDFFRGIGNGISSAAEWTGQTARSAGTAVRDGAVATGTAVRDGAVATGTAVRDGAGVVWDYTADVSATTGILVTQSLPAMAGFGDDAAMRPQVGRVEGYAGGWPPCEQIPRQLKVKIPFQRGAQQAAAVANAQAGAATTVQVPAQSFLYLDVGRWGGTGASAKRDFGIVCGRTAALCAFNASGEATLTDGPQDEIGPINALLGKLGGSSLGAPKVRRYMTSRTRLPPGVTTLSQRVYVIVGDMHLPVATGVSPSGTQPPEQSELRGRRVGRTRRVDVGKDMGIESDSDASLWHERYVGGEIFQQAGPDLSAFVGLLTRARGNIGAELWLMQLGDMFDLWLGFDCFLAPDPPKSSGRAGNEGRVRLRDMTVTPTPPIDPSVMAAGLGGGMAMPMVMPPQPRLQDTTPRTVTTAVEFVDTWINRTMYNTSQSQHVRDFLQFDANASKYLYGNHDNYLGAHAPSELMRLRGGQGMTKEHHDARALFYACHGHQWDKFNRDGAVGGMATTQTAFWTPRIRSIEPDDRSTSLLGSADLFRSGSKPFCVFAMGHTHTAILTEIAIEMEPEPAPVQYPPMPIM